MKKITSGAFDTFWRSTGKMIEESKGVFVQTYQHRDGSSGDTFFVARKTNDNMIELSEVKIN